MGMNSMASAAAIFHSGNIEVSKTLVRVGGTSYPVNGIGSVYVRAPKRMGTIITGIILIVLTIPFFGSGQLPIAFGFAIFGALLIIAAIGRPHVLVLRTASGDQQALRSGDKKLLFAVKSAIEEAVALRG